jgi:ATP-dependent DNA helicase RecG
MQPIGDIVARIGHGEPASAFESQILDFKRPGRSAKETLELLADAAVCFANAQGGTIVLGVDDKATTRESALVGVEPALSIDAVRRGIFERTRPNLTVSAEEHSIDGVRLLVLTVVEGIELYSNARGLATRRLGSDCLPFPPEQQLEVRRARGQLDWSAEEVDHGPEALSQIEFERVRRLLRTSGREELASLNDKKQEAPRGDAVAHTARTANPRGGDSPGQRRAPSSRRPRLRLHLPVQAVARQRSVIRRPRHQVAAGRRRNAA